MDKTQLEKLQDKYERVEEQKEILIKTLDKRLESIKKEIDELNSK